jgi:hypothetical protein
MLRRGWYALKGPEIGVKLVHPSAHVFRLEVGNIRGAVVNAKVFLDDVTDSQDRTIMADTGIFEIKGNNFPRPVRLFGKAREVFAILTIDWRDAAGPYYRVDTISMSKDEQGSDTRTIQELKIGISAPVAQHQETRFKFRVVFYDADTGKEWMDEVFRYAAIPMPSTSEFKLVPLRPHQRKAV